MSSNLLFLLVLENYGVDNTNRENRIYSTDNIAPCLTSQSQGNLCGYGCLIVVEENECSNYEENK